MTEGPEREDVESGDERIDESGRNPTRRGIDDDRGGHAPPDADWGAGADEAADAETYEDV